MSFADNIASLRRLNRIPAEIDHLALWSALLLLAMGLVMVFSSSVATAEGSKSTSFQAHYYLIRHLSFLGIGLVAALFTFQFPLSFWQKWAPRLFVLGMVLLVLVFLPSPIGKMVNGARRWINLQFFNLQPSELMKLFVILYTADYTVRKIAVMHDLKKVLLPMATAIAVVGVLLLLEPDYGSLVVIVGIVMGMLFLAGINLRVFVLVFLVASIFLGLFAFSSPYRRERLLSFSDPWNDPFGSGYQLSHALIAFGRGEFFGVGLGASVEKLFYLPEAHTDFILAVIAEELGFFGVLIVIALFMLLIQRAFVIGREAVRLDRPYPALVAMGIGTWLGIQTIINMAVNMGWFPTKGLTLPLMSYGGSSIVVTCVTLAILLRIDWENRQVMRGKPV